MYNFTLKIITSLSSVSMIFSDGYAGYNAVCRENGITQLRLLGARTAQIQRSQKSTD